MAFNNRKLARLIEEERKQQEAANNVEFEDDFADDFDDAEPQQPEAAPEAAQPEPTVEEEPAAEPEPAAEEPEQPVYEEPETVAEPEPEPVVEAVPEEEPQQDDFDPMERWMCLTNLAVEAKHRISSGAYFRANDVVSAMRTIIIEFICHGSRIDVDNADMLSDEDKESIYRTYPKAFNEPELTESVNFMMSLALKYL